MPKRQKYVVRGKGGKVIKRGYIKPKTAVDKAQNKRIAKIERVLKDEKHMCDVKITRQTLQQPNTVGTGVACFHLTNQLEKGDAVYNRTGDKITLQNLQVAVKVETDLNIELVNLLLVYFPHGCKTNVPPQEQAWSTNASDDALIKFRAMTLSLPDPQLGTTEQYITDQNDYGINQSTWRTIFNPNTDFSYKILFNKQIKLNNNANQTNYGSNHDRYITMNLKKFVSNKKVEYQTTSPASVLAPEVVRGSYVLYAWDDRSPSTTGRARISGRCRMKWLG